MISPMAMGDPVPDVKAPDGTEGERLAEWERDLLAEQLSRAISPTHGVYYVERGDSPVIYKLSNVVFPDVPRPERDVALALLRFAIERLEAQNAPPEPA